MIKILPPKAQTLCLDKKDLDQVHPRHIVGTPSHQSKNQQTNSGPQCYDFYLHQRKSVRGDLPWGQNRHTDLWWRNFSVLYRSLPRLWVDYGHFPLDQCLSPFLGVLVTDFQAAVHTLTAENSAGWTPNQMPQPISPRQEKDFFRNHTWLHFFFWHV